MLIRTVGGLTPWYRGKTKHLASCLFVSGSDAAYSVHPNYSKEFQQLTFHAERYRVSMFIMQYLASHCLGYVFSNIYRSYQQHGHEDKSNRHDVRE